MTKMRRIKFVGGGGGSICRGSSRRGASADLSARPLSDDMGRVSQSK